MSDGSPGKVITFYSYKGGTGRTMALANVACLLADDQSAIDKRPILVIDWDLEAPGLHRFFRDYFSTLTRDVRDPDNVINETKGLIDLFCELRDATSHYTPENPQPQSEARALLDTIRPESFILATDITGLFFLKSGCIDDKYSERVNTFEWEKFHLRAPWLIRSFCERLAKSHRYVLIDSRTGLTDVSGICTMLVPERLVFVFTPNRQSIQDGMKLIERATNYRRNSSDLRPLVVFPLVSRVEPARDKLRHDWRMGNPDKGIEGFQPQFEELFKRVYQLNECSLEEYFTEVQIQHNPDYAYGEVIAVKVETTEDRLSLKRSYRTFAERLLSSPGPWMKEPLATDSPETRATPILFKNGKSARMVNAPPDARPRDIIHALGLSKVSAVIMLVGVPGLNSLSAWLDYSLPRIVSDIDWLVIDSGLQGRGLTSLARGLAERGRGQSLLGVAPSGKVTYPGLQTTEDSPADSEPLDSNHSQFVLIDGQEWGDERELKVNLAKELATDRSVVTIVLGDGPNVTKELLRIAREGWPIVVAEGSGKLADELAALSRDSPRRETASDPALEEIVHAGNVMVISESSGAAEIDRIVYASLPSGKALEKAWRRFSLYHRRVVRRERLSTFLRWGPLGLGCVGIILWLLRVVLRDWTPEFFQWIDKFGAPALVFVTVTLLQTAFAFRSTLMNAEIKHVAEGIRSEIFRYRSRSGRYSVTQSAGPSVESRLREAIATLEIQAEPNSIRDSGGPKLSLKKMRSFQPAGREDFDDGFSPLTPKKYVAARLNPMLGYYVNRGQKIRQRRTLFAMTLSTIALLSIVIYQSVNLSILLPLATTFAIACAAALRIFEVGREERTPMAIASRLVDVMSWWNALPHEKEREQKALDNLVADTEEALAIDWRLDWLRLHKNSEQAHKQEAK